MQQRIAPPRSISPWILNSGIDQLSPRHPACAVFLGPTWPPNPAGSGAQLRARHRRLWTRLSHPVEHRSADVGHRLLSVAANSGTHSWSAKPTGTHHRSATQWTRPSSSADMRQQLLRLLRHASASSSMSRTRGCSFSSTSHRPHGGARIIPGPWQSSATRFRQCPRQANAGAAALPCLRRRS